jgi:uncharacterized protein (TIGR02453 family)
MPPHFSPAALKFLRGLQRNNDRDWFNARKDVYERELKAPMLALISAVNERLGEFAPEHVRAPEKGMLRIYRDIRFSKDKLPYKTHASAWWARQGLEKTSGGGFYFEFSPAGVTIAAGVYMPEREQLLAIRRHLLEHGDAYRATLQKIEAAKRPATLAASPMKAMDGLKLTRAPKGFPAEHPAADLILQRQWGVGSTLAAEAVLGEGLLDEIVTRFRLAAPLVALLNAPLQAKPKAPMF